MNNRYVLKLEANLLEQTYKFNEDDNLRTFEDVKKLVDEDFLISAFILILYYL